jgi:light-harvesting complex 1 beta chain
MTSFVIFTLIAIAAHVLVWMWRPWLPGVHGYSELQNAAHYAQLLASRYIA